MEKRKRDSDGTIRTSGNLIVAQEQKYFSGDQREVGKQLLIPNHQLKSLIAEFAKE
jgi:hypothetical protein